MISFLKEMWTGFKEKKSLHAKLFSVILLLAVIAIQVILILNLADILRFAFYYEYDYHIDPIRTIREEPDWITAVDLLLLGILFELDFIFDREKIYSFSGLVLRKAPSGIPGAFFIASAVYLSLYILGALQSFFFGASFLFKTYHDLDALELYLLLSVYLVFPIVLLLASVIYIIVYLKIQKKKLNTPGETLEAEFWED